MSAQIFTLEDADPYAFELGGEGDPGEQVVLVIGPKGDPGDSINLLSRTAGEALSGHRAVKIAGDGKAYYVSPGDADVDAIAGITVGAASAEADASIMANGEMTEGSWSWTPGPVWLATNGVPTQTAPTSGAVVRLGTALGATTMFVEPRLIAIL